MLTQAGRLWCTGNLNEEKATRLKKMKIDLGADDDKEEFDFTDPVTEKN